MAMADRFADHLPPMLRASWLRCAAAVGLLATWSLAAMLGIMIRGDDGMPRWRIDTDVFLSVHVAILAILVLTIFDHQIRRRRLRRTLDDSGGLACGHCGHSLRMVTERGRCSECGAIFDVARLQGYWHRLFAPRWRDPPSLRASRAPVAGIALYLSIMVVIVVLLPIAFGRSQSAVWTLRSALLGLSLIVPIWLGGWWLLHVRRKRDIARRVWRGNFATCGFCVQPLPEGADPVTCAYCHTKHVRSELRSAWLRDCPAHWRVEGLEF